MIFHSFDKNNRINGYRLPTIREIASFMSFPITYQFEANNESNKYRLVGNAVCPKLSAALAEAIAKNEKTNIPKDFLPLPEKVLTVELRGRKRKIKIASPRKSNSKFAYHVPSLKIKSFRVELTNKGSDFKKNKLKWNCLLHYGSGKNANFYEIDLEDSSKFLNGFNQFNSFSNEIKKLFNEKISAKTLQEEYCKNNDSVGPMALLDKIGCLVDKYFSEPGIEVDNTFKQIKRKTIPLKILAALYACNYFISRIV